MFDTMVFTKIVGAFCGALLIFLLGQWAAETLYLSEGGHGEHAEQAYVIDTGEEDHGEEEPQEVTFQMAFAAPDPQAGSRVWNQCRACHSLEEGQNGVGPSLHGVVGREAGSVEGFNYSGALPEGQTWTPDEIEAFLADPGGYASGTSMGFAGLSDVEDRANVIAYVIEESGQDLAEYVTEAPEETAPEGEDEAPAEAEEAAAEGGEDAQEQSMEQLVASVDPAEGEGLWNQCRACHALEEGVNRVGPSLYGVVGRDVGSVEGFNYSGALSEAADVWTYENISALIESPRDFAPGTSMGFAGMESREDRARVIAYIESQGPAPRDADEGDGEAAPGETDDAAADTQDATDSATEEASAPAGDAGADEAEPADNASVTDEQAAGATDDGEVETAEVEEAPADDAAQSEFARLVASADPADGESLWNQCRACHALEEGVNRVGPSLYDVVGREVGAIEDFRYSGALSEVADVWTYDNLDGLLEAPREFAPGTTMGFAGFSSVEDRANVIAYIEAQAQ